LVVLWDWGGEERVQSSRVLFGLGVRGSDEDEDADEDEDGCGEEVSSFLVVVVLVVVLLVSFVSMMMMMMMVLLFNCFFPFLCSPRRL
jgi:uncharacterized protein YqhQ